MLLGLWFTFVISSLRCFVVYDTCGVWLLLCLWFCYTGVFWWLCNLLLCIRWLVWVLRYIWQFDLVGRLRPWAVYFCV